MTAAKISTLAEALDQPLDAKRVKSRQAGGGRPALSYLETHDVIRTANAIFGFGKWGHEIVELRPIAPVTVHGKDGNPGVAVGYVCIVRLTVEGCVATSGVGYGDAVEYRESAAVTAHELAAKEAESDALKRALKNYGDQFGLALYDKQAASSGHVTSSARQTAKPQKDADVPEPLRSDERAQERRELQEAVQAGIDRLGAVDENWTLTATLAAASKSFGKQITALADLNENQLSQILTALTLAEEQLVIEEVPA